MGIQSLGFCTELLGLGSAVVLLFPLALISVQKKRQAPQLEFVFEVRAKIADPIVIGQVSGGTRRIINILEGTFEGPKIKGKLLPGGADWQLTRPDGDVELYARYTLKTKDGALIQVQNRVLVHISKDSKSGPYIRSVIDFEAPSTSSCDWLNHAIFLGTLTVPQTMPKDKPYVIIGVYKLQ